MIAGELEEGEFVYVRFEIRRGQPSELDSFLARLPMPAAGNYACSYQWIPRSCIVCREPKAMEADGGIVRGIE